MSDENKEILEQVTELISSKKENVKGTNTKKVDNQSETKIENKENNNLRTETPTDSLVRSELRKWINIIKPNGIILSGGSDIGKNKIRDVSEKLLINISIRKNIPLIGICRGMQLIGNYFNTKLIKVKNHVNQKHNILSRSKKLKVNSFHNYSLKDCPKNFKILFHSEDGHIEAIHSKNKKIYACMWHPERNKKFEKWDIKIFKSFFNKKKF